MTDKKIIRKRFELEFGNDENRYNVTEFYRGGGSSKRQATPTEVRQYQEALQGPSVIGRQLECVHDVEEGRFEDSD